MLKMYENLVTGCYNESLSRAMLLEAGHWDYFVYSCDWLDVRGC